MCRIIIIEKITEKEKKMLPIGDIIMLIALAVTLVLAVLAIIQGYNGMKVGKLFETSDNKIKVGYWVLSAIQMWAGIIITICYLIAGVVILNTIQGM